MQPAAILKNLRNLLQFYWKGLPKVKKVVKNPGLLSSLTTDEHVTDVFKVVEFLLYLNQITSEALLHHDAL